ncbi:MAG: hypothetical protein KA340_02510 [Saprospiraceae bacterium]|nr:hypothetical protein [Saprospiraceae bacterium]
MRVLIIIVVIDILFSKNLSSQKYDENYYVRSEIEANFKHQISKLHFYEDSISLEFIRYCDGQDGTNTSVNAISDSLGNLLFYFVNKSLYNKYHEFIFNGDSLENNFNLLVEDGSTDSSSYTISDHDVFVLPVPGMEGQFLFFYRVSYRSKLNGYKSPIYFSRVDMNQLNGKGAIVERNILLSSANHHGMIPIKHANGIDWWILCPVYGENMVYTFLLTSEGLIYNNSKIFEISPDNYYYKIFIGTVASDFTGSYWSSEGNMFAVSYANEDVLFFEFDRCNGNIRYAGVFVQKNKEIYPVGNSSVVFDDLLKVAYFSNRLGTFLFDYKCAKVTQLNVEVVRYKLDSFFSSILQYRDKYLLSNYDRIKYIPKVWHMPEKFQFDKELAISQEGWIFRLHRYPNYRLGKSSGYKQDECIINEGALSSNIKPKFVFLEKEYFSILQN